MAWQQLRGRERAKVKIRVSCVGQPRLARFLATCVAEALLKLPEIVQPTYLYSIQKKKGHLTGVDKRRRVRSSDIA